MSRWLFSVLLVCIFARLPPVRLRAGRVGLVVRRETRTSFGRVGFAGQSRRTAVSLQSD